MVLAPTVQIASLGMADTFILMVMALVVFGPRRLPQIGRQIGKLMYEFRKASNDFKFQMEEELRNAEEADRRKKEEERLRTLALAAPAPTPALAETPTAAPATGTSTDATGTPATETVNPAAIYDNGSVASTQPAGTEPADTAPIIRPPSTGDPIAAARAWSREYEEAKAAQATKAAEPSASAATEPAESPAPGESDFAQPETIASEPASSTSVAEAPPPTTGIAVNHHG